MLRVPCLWRGLSALALGASLRRAGYTLIVANDQVDPSRPAAWSKIPAVARAFDAGYSLVLCADADALIMNPALRVEELFDWRTHQTLASDHNGPNSGAHLSRRVGVLCVFAL